MIKWYNVDNKKYDYVVANFSIMHFMTDVFWQELEKYTHSGTKFLFNIVANKIVNWKCNDSYLYVENNMTKYKFEWTHNSMKMEPYIDEEDILKYLKQYNWNVLNKIQYYDNPDNLSNQYTWWIVEKINL